MRYCKPVAVHFKIRGSTRVICESMQGPGLPFPGRLNSLCREQEQLEGSGKGEDIPFGRRDV